MSEAVPLLESTSTWENAVINCRSKSANIEMDFNTIKQLNIPDGTEFWLPKYTAVTPWIDIIGMIDFNFAT